MALASTWLTVAVLPPMAAAAVDPLGLHTSRTIRGGFAAAGTCIGDNAAGGPSGGTLTLTGIPPGALVLEAYLYYVVLHTDSPVPAGSPTLDGTPLSPVRLGEIADSPCFVQTHTATFRADVTPLVTGDGTYALAGFPAAGGISGTFTEGATLVVIYCHPTLPASDVVVFDGIDVLSDSARSHSQTLTGFTATASGPVTASWLAVIGNGQTTIPDSDPLAFNGTLIESLVPSDQVLAGSACAAPVNQGWWDLGLYDVSPLVTNGSTTAVITLSVVTDCYSVAAYVLAVSTDEIPEDCGTPLSVSFDAFSVRPHPDGVEIGWTTLDETGTLGFRLWSRARDGSESELPGLVRARGGGSVYSRIVADSTGTTDAQSLAYQVREITLDGRPGSSTPWVGIASDPDRAPARGRFRGPRARGR